MDLVKKIDSLIGEASWDDSWETPMKNLGKNWWSDDGVSSRVVDRNTQVEVIWKPGQKHVKVQFRNMKNREYIGHAMVPTSGMKSKEFLKHVDKDMKNIWKSKKRGMKEGRISPYFNFGLPKVKGWELEADNYEMDYSKELPDGRILHLVLNDMDFPTDGSAIVTYPEGSKRTMQTSWEVKSEKDIPNVLKRIEKWGK